MLLEWFTYLIAFGAGYAVGLLHNLLWRWFGRLLEGTV